MKAWQEDSPTPSYLRLYGSGELADRARGAQIILGQCRLCGWNCGIDRGREIGPCHTGMEARVATAYVHFGEESPIVGRGGSGAIFFANCDLRCQFCQTFRWNILGQGYEVTPQQLAEIMLSLQSKGAVNINLVTPTHVTAQILAALSIAARNGLRLPLVWNSGGHDSMQALALLDGVVDIYMPDLKYGIAELGLRLSAIHDYPVVNRQAVIEMHRQVGDLRISPDGVARRGLLARHLVMPGHLDNTASVLTWLRDTIGTQTYLSLLNQYRPAYRAFNRAELGKPISPEEFERAYRFAIELGFARIDQGHGRGVESP